MATVTVVGSATATVRPDRVVARLQLSSLAAQPADAIDAVAASSRRLEALLADVGIAAEESATSGIEIGEEWQHRRDENVLVGYRASVRVAVTVTDLEVLGRLVRDAVAHVGAQVQGLDWSVDATNPVRRELLGQAAVDARARADAYATALGLTVSAVDAVSELPLSAPPEPMPRGGAAFAMKMASAEMDQLATSPGQVEITARVHVRFNVLP